MKPDPKTDPCFYCAKHSADCHTTCREYKIAAVLRELEKRKISKYNRERPCFMTVAEKERTLYNRKKYTRHGNRRY